MITCSSMHNMSPETVCRFSVESLNNKELLLSYHKQRNLDSRNELVRRYVFIAERLSEKYGNREIDNEDIRKAALQGLMNAVDRFDVEWGIKFPGFAISTIIGEIKSCFRDRGWYARLPQRIRELSGKISLCTDIVMQKLNRTPKIEDLTTCLNCTEEEIIEAMESAWEKSPTPAERYKDKFMKRIHDNTVEKPE
jgi:RNA polymerase sigma-B factor